MRVPSLIVACMLLGLVLAGCANETDAAPVTELRFAVDGMTCTNCEGAITQAVESIDGVVSCTASHEDGTAVVAVTDPTVVDEIVAAVSGLQYGIAPAD